MRELHALRWHGNGHGRPVGRWDLHWYWGDRGEHFDNFDYIGRALTR